MKVYDLRGLELRDPVRKEAYPESPHVLGEPMRYLHLQSSQWYFDASDPANQAEADRVIGELCFTAETWNKSWSAEYKPLHVVVAAGRSSASGRSSDEVPRFAGGPAQGRSVVLD
jgi:hypothetical protein